MPLVGKCGKASRTALLTRLLLCDAPDPLLFPCSLGAGGTAAAFVCSQLDAVSGWEIWELEHVRRVEAMQQQYCGPDGALLVSFDETPAWLQGAGFQMASANMQRWQVPFFA